MKSKMLSGELLFQQVLGFRKGPHLHEGMTFQRKGSTGDPSEALTHVSQRAGSQDLRLVVHDERQGNAKENLGAFVEETVPDPQHRLQGEETTGSLEETCANTLRISLTSIGRTST